MVQRVDSSHMKEQGRARAKSSCVDQVFSYPETGDVEGNCEDKRVISSIY